ncbi:hypothetical protein Tco_0561144 [Tanacetum coccineum]
MVGGVVMWLWCVGVVGGGVEMEMKVAMRCVGGDEAGAAGVGWQRCVPPAGMAGTLLKVAGRRRILEREKETYVRAIG